MLVCCQQNIKHKQTLELPLQEEGEVISINGKVTALWEKLLIWRPYFENGYLEMLTLLWFCAVKTIKKTPFKNLIFYFIYGLYKWRISAGLDLFLKCKNVTSD